jgi:hypothetical protein
LLICPKFNNLGFILLDSIQTLTPNNNNIDINIDLLLHGNRSFSYDLNTEIFQAVHKFIIDTHRFILDASFFNCTPPIIHLFCVILFFFNFLYV